jgi:O-antigen ligase
MQPTESRQRFTRPKARLMHRSLIRRRSIDPILLSIAIACFPIKLELDMVLLAFFIGSGLYLIFSRHRASRFIDPQYATAAILYGTVVIALGIYHGDISENLRWIGLPLYFAMGIPLFAGFVLIKDPIRQISIGARIGLLLVLAVAIYESLTGTERVGLGGNAANAAFIISVVAVMARFQVSNPPSLLPNTRAWFYLAVIPVVMTGTRSVLPVFAVAAIIDFLQLRGGLLAAFVNISPRRILIITLTGLVVIAATVYKTSVLVMSRFEYTIAEMDSLSAPPEQRVTGLDIRINLWKGAFRIFQEHPFVGVGGSESMRQIKAGIPVTQKEMYQDFVHVHFFALDEIRDRGMIGAVFLFGMLGVIVRKMVRNASNDVKANTLIFVSSCLLYGSLHGLLLGDRNVVAIIIFFVGVLATQRRQGGHQFKN